jgi:hypothetical protein
MTAEVDREGGWRRRVAVLLVAGLALNPTVPLAGAGANNGAATGALDVQSEPAGANVFVDGKLAGRTPVQVATLDPGDHRVRVVKDGFLENARVVGVGAGETRSVHVKLTPHSGPSTAAMEQVSGGGGGGSRKWLWIGLAGGGAAAATLFLLNRNSPPIAGDITVSPNATGMAGVTSFTFTSTASDEDGDALTYNWNFGDGGTGTGASPSRVFSSAGTFTVSVSISDGKETVTAPSTTVRVGPAITGTWTGGRDNVFECGINTTLSQNAGTLTGTLSLVTGCSGTITITSGTVSPLTHPSTVTWVSNTFTFNVGTTSFPGMMYRFSGTTDTAGTVMNGTLTTSQASSGFSQATPVTFRR